ncbi:hypothetical protein Tco_0256812 [Tanacetum coccineum]
MNTLAKGLVFSHRVLVTHPHNKTPYVLLSGKVPNISHLKPFGCLVTILNTSDHLGKFEGKADEGFIVGYAAHSTQVTNIPAGTQDDSDSECDEQVIVVLISHAKLVAVQEHEAKDTAEKYGFSKDTKEYLRQADMVPAGSIDPTASISTSTHEPFPTVIEPVHADETSLPPGHSLGSSEHFLQDIFSSDFAKTRVNTIHPSQYRYLEISTSPVQTQEDIEEDQSTHTIYIVGLLGFSLSQLEPSRVDQDLNDPGWVCIGRWQQFIITKVWTVVPLQMGKLLLDKLDYEEQKNAIGLQVNSRSLMGSLSARQCKSKPLWYFFKKADYCCCVTVVVRSYLLVALLVSTDRTILTESFWQTQLQLEDEGCVEDLPIADIYIRHLFSSVNLCAENVILKNVGTVRKRTYCVEDTYDRKRMLEPDGDPLIKPG